MKNLGHLEAAVMDILWSAQDEPLRVRDVLDRLPAEPARAYTTVMTVLDNLHRKGWVVRHSDRRGYRYQPALPRAQVAAQAIRDALDSVEDAEAMLQHFRPERHGAWGRRVTTCTAPTPETRSMIVAGALLLCAATAKAARSMRRHIVAQRRAHRAHLLAVVSTRLVECGRCAMA